MNEKITKIKYRIEKQLHRNDLLIIEWNNDFWNEKVKYEWIYQVDYENEEVLDILKEKIDENYFINKPEIKISKLLRGIKNKYYGI